MPSVSMLGDLSPAVGILVAIFGAVVSHDAAEQHGFICLAKSLPQLRLHFIPTQAAGKDLVRPLHEIVFHIPAYCFLITHNNFSRFDTTLRLCKTYVKAREPCQWAIADWLELVSSERKNDCATNERG